MPQLVVGPHVQLDVVVVQVLPIEQVADDVHEPLHSPVVVLQRCAPQTAPGFAVQFG